MIPLPSALALGWAILVLGGAPASIQDGPSPMSRAEAAEVLKKALAEARRADGPEKEAEALRRAADQVARGRPENFLVADALRGPADAPAAEPSRQAERWRSAVSEALEVLEFEVEEESPLPDGFPKPTPLGEIAVQSYPVYRAARADLGDGDDGAFMRLFGHITTRGISMTAPVEMNYSRGEKEGSRKVAMSFLYRNTGQGTLGGDQVKVVDVDKLTAVSLGLRGYPNEERVKEARGRLEAWLASHAKEYRAAGPVRTLIYNSPFLPAKRQFYEVQIPVEPGDPAKPPGDAAAESR